MADATGPVPVLAGLLANTARALADTVPTGWPLQDGALDALDGLDAVLDALARLDPDARRILGPARLAAARLRHHLDTPPPGPPSLPGPRTPCPTVPHDHGAGPDPREVTGP
ncbi:hypothetical protein ACFYVL_42995 [Streptomyces sp. NPDC004111]|uniref:hypothetical protein n=1 Tax=Streptomyces sp. NPDC004111 TaxID=3364690 RepID=UPI0036B36418